ncbi:hypothetical protein V8D89_012429 [Ganoderma adspersum]
MVAYDPSEDISFPSPYDHPPSDEAGPPPDMTFANVPYQSHSHQGETLPSIHGHWYDVDDFNGSNYYFDSSHGITTGNSHVSPYDTASSYATGGLWNVGPTLPPNYMAAGPTVLYPNLGLFPVPANNPYHDTPPSTTPGTSFPSPPTPPLVQEFLDPQATHQGYGPRCLWGTQACDQKLSDGSSATVRAHLRDAHGIGLGTGASNARRARCLWGGECSLSSEHILVSGMAKHVATCHLKTTSLSCPSCGRVCSRRDALQRHADLYCQAAKQPGGYRDGRGETTARRSQRA